MNITRDQRQAQNIEKWKENNCRGTLEAATGYGKTRTAIKALKRIKEKNNIKALVVVPTNYLEEQWNERLDNFGLSEVEVQTIQSLISDYKKTGEKRKVTLLIPDEIHKYTADVFGKLYNIVDFSMILGLSATIPEDERGDFIESYAPVFDTVTLEECKENDWVSDFIVYQLPISLNEEEQEKYNELTDKFYDNFSWFNHDWDKVTKCLNNDIFCKRWARKNHARPGRIKGHASRVTGSVQERKGLLYNSRSKLDVASKILQKFPDKLTICFSQRTEFADKIGDRFPDRCFVYHSGIDGKNIGDEYYGVERLKEWGIDQFSDPSSETNILSTARAFDQGVDIPAIDLGIITSATSKSLQAIQRVGRTLRYEENKVAIIVDIFAEDTQDEFWLRKRYKDFPQNSIRRISNIKDIQHL